MAESRQRQQDPADLEDVLSRMADAAEGKERVSVGDVLEGIGNRSFGPLLLIAGLVTLAPVVGDIPGVPTLIGLLVILTSAQLLMRRKHFWLPRWLLDRSIGSAKLCKAIGWLERPARSVDRLLRPRLHALVQGVAVYVIGVVSLLIALLTPAMEVVPFSANGAGLVLTLLGLALISGDGLMALLAFVITAATGAAIVYNLV